MKSCCTEPTTPTPREIALLRARRALWVVLLVVVGLAAVVGALRGDAPTRPIEVSSE